MKDIETKQPEFDIHVNLNGEETAIQVKPDETSDGASYFVCQVSGEVLTQIREEADGSWDQIWGELDHQSLNAIGKAIKQHHQTL